MAVAKVISANDIINGGSVNAPAAGGNYKYNPADRVQDIPDPSVVNFFKHTNGLYRSGEWQEELGAPLAQAADNNQSASGDAVVYYAAEDYIAHTVRGLGFAYETDPGAGSGFLQIESPSGTAVWGPQPITDKGAGFFDFPEGLRGVMGADMLVRVKFGGAGVTGSVSVKGHRKE